MYLCHCHVVTHAAVTDAVDAGAASLARVCRSTGAGRDCGACVLSIKRVMHAHQQSVQAAVATCSKAVCGAQIGRDRPRVASHSSLG
jgi:bacterioferritin-associated ferredoxin